MNQGHLNTQEKQKEQEVSRTQVHGVRAGVALLVSSAAPQLHQLDVQLVQNRSVQRADGVDQLQTHQEDIHHTVSDSLRSPPPGPGSSDLVWVRAQVEVLQETGGELTEQEVVCVVDGPQAPVRVVVGAGAGAERAHWNTNTRT